VFFLVLHLLAVAVVQGIQHLQIQVVLVAAVVLTVVLVLHHLQSHHQFKVLQVVIHLTQQLLQVVAVVQLLLV
jgi:hypothetical protein